MKSSKAVPGTASWTATERAPHQRIAQPEDAAARTVGGSRKNLGARNQKFLRAARCEFRVCGVLSSLRDVQRGAVRLHGARMQGTRSCKRGKQCCVAAQRSPLAVAP